MKHLHTSVVALLLTAFTSAQDPLRDIRSAEPETRLKAIEGLITDGGEDAVKQLIAALKDRDWEVQRNAAMALGTLRATDGLKKLADLALKGDIVQVRYAAADAVAAIDAAAGTEILLKKATGKRSATVACEALGRIWAITGVAETDKLQKLLKNKERDVRIAAAIAWLAGSAERGEALRTLLQDDDIVLQAAALDLVTRVSRTGDVAVLAERLRAPRAKDDTIERRQIAAAAAAVQALAEAEREKAIEDLLDAAKGYSVRYPRLTVALFLAGALNPAQALERIEAAPTDGEDVSAASAKALGVLATKESSDVARRRYGREGSGRVRYQLVDAFCRGSDLKKAENARWLAGCAEDPDPKVRECAVVHLGARGLDGAIPALKGALEDRIWTIAVTAAVSLGKTFDDRALEPLLALCKHDDWRRRGAAAVGLMHLNRKAVVDPLIELVGDDVAMVQNAAHHALMKIFTHRTAELDQEKWRQYWSRERDKFIFRDWKAIEESNKRYGYAVPDRDIYDGLDVVVFVSRGDHIENLLGTLEIPFRTTQAAKVTEAGLHPEAIFVSNCTGEIEADDVVPLQWFVHTGGALFGSCWSLQKTIERVYPGIVRKLPTPQGEVLGDVRACPCLPNSQFLNGVFPEHVTPIYHLEGAHLIDVIDPERAEILIDSPDAAETYGGGNLAAWFHVGHGIILDSVNHFDLQGLMTAKGLKTPDDRQIYAVEHMGLPLGKLRELKRKAYWKNATKSSQEVPDRSAFRFLTNFVRSKRSRD